MKLDLLKLVEAPKNSELDACHAAAQKKSKDEGVVQHINKDPETGKHHVSDWYVDGETVASYNKGKLKEGFVPEVLDVLKEAFAMDDIAIGGTVIYKVIGKDYYKMSKVKSKREPYTLRLWSGDTIENAAVVSTDASDWKDYKDKKSVKEAEEQSWKWSGFKEVKNHGGEGYPDADDRPVDGLVKAASKAEALAIATKKNPSVTNMRVEPASKSDLEEAAKWRGNDLEGKTWRSKDWDDGELSPDKIQIDKKGKDVDDVGDELNARPGAWRGKADMAKRVTKKGVPTKSEVAFQGNLKNRIKAQGGLTGPKGALPESAEYAKAIVRGEKAGPGLLNKLDQWFSKMIITKDANRFLPAEVALDQLKRAGFSQDQITMIRDAATSAANTAVETMNKKHGEEAVPRKYISKLPSSFGVFDLYLNVGEDIHVEFAALMRKLFDAKIAKIKDKLNIVKEAAKLPDGWTAKEIRDYPGESDTMQLSYKGKLLATVWRTRQNYGKIKREGDRQDGDVRYGHTMSADQLIAYAIGMLRPSVQEASALNDVSIDDMKDTRTADSLQVGDAVEISGAVNFHGSTGEIERFGQGKKFVVVKLNGGGSHSFHSSDVTAVDHDADDVEDDEDAEPQKFYVAFYDNDEERSWVGVVTKEGGGKWHEKAFKGNPEGRWGQSYMSYLKPSDIMSWIHKDYHRGMEIEGPFDNSADAEDHVKHNWGDLKESAMIGEGKKIYREPGVANVNYKQKMQWSKDNPAPAGKDYTKFDVEVTFRDGKKEIFTTPAPSAAEAKARVEMEMQERKVTGYKMKKPVVAEGTITEKINLGSVKRVIDNEKSLETRNNAEAPKRITWDIEVTFANGKKEVFAITTPKSKEAVATVEAALKRRRATGYTMKKATKVTEGIAKTVKRGLQGWVAGLDLPITGTANKPKDVVARVRGYSDRELKAVDGDDEPTKHSPRDLQKKVIDREMKKRGMKEGVEYTNYHDWKQAVLNSHPTQAHAIKFRGKMEGEKTTIFAAIPGDERVFGMWEDDTDTGHVLSEGDWGKRDFKRKELEFELGHETNDAPKSGNRTFTPQMFGIEINNKLWQRDGKPVEFRSKATAEKSAATIAAKGKTTKVVPL